MQNLKVLVNKFHYTKKGEKSPLNGVFVFVLRLIAIFYFFIICFKNLLYEKGILKEKENKSFIICVGNLTTGGVGKTPLVCEISDFCTKVLDKKVAIVSRGYGAKLDNKKVNVIKNFEEILYNDGAICGDEALLIAKNTNGAVVLTCRDRFLAANFARENFGAEIVILDDGFSNRKMKKDVTILAVDSKKRFGNGLTLPVGPLREPLWQAKRADFLVVVDKENSKNAAEIKEKIKNRLKLDNAVLCNFLPDKIYEINSKRELLSQGQKVGAFCAIGQPEQFFSYLHKGFDLAYTKSFADHFAYKKSDLDQLVQFAQSFGAKYLITTQKDEVKIKPLLNDIDPVKFAALKLKLKFENDQLFSYIKDKFREFEKRRSF